jgi:hypothetical protein
MATMKLREEIFGRSELDKAEWFAKVDADTYFVADNLKRYVVEKNWMPSATHVFIFGLLRDQILKRPSELHHNKATGRVLGVTNVKSESNNLNTSGDFDRQILQS